jgi:hypothetical protein
LDVDLSGDQELLRDTTVKFIESAFPLSRVRETPDFGVLGGTTMGVCARTMRVRQAHDADPGIAAYGKLATGTLDPIRARIGVEIGRGRVLAWEHGNIDAMAASVNYLNGRVMSIAGGSNEMQRNGIGERVLGLPREPSFDTNRPFSEVIRNAKSWSGKVG